MATLTKRKKLKDWTEYIRKIEYVYILIKIIWKSCVFFLTKKKKIYLIKKTL